MIFKVARWLQEQIGISGGQNAVNRLLAEKIFWRCGLPDCEKNYHDSSSVFQRRHGLRQNFCQTFQFFINDDAQGLESFGSRMNFIAPQTARNRFLIIPPNHRSCDAILFYAAPQFLWQCGARVFLRQNWKLFSPIGFVIIMTMSRVRVLLPSELKAISSGESSRKENPFWYRPAEKMKVRDPEQNRQTKFLRQNFPRWPRPSWQNYH